MSSFNSFFQHLKQPEYVHVLFNPLPVYGLLIGALILGMSWVVRSRPVQVTGLLLIFIVAASAWPVYVLGERAYHNIYLRLEPDGQACLDIHMHRAEKFIYVFYLLATVAASALLWPKKFPKTVSALAILTFALALGTLGIG